MFTIIITTIITTIIIIMFTNYDDDNKECWLCPSMKWVKKGRQGQVSPPK